MPATSGRPRVAYGWLIALGLLNVYIVFLFWLVRTGRMEKWNLSLMLGIVLMVRTQHGKKLLDLIARPRRFWNLFGDAGTAITLLGMAGMTIIMLALVPFALDPASGAPALGASEILVIPGVNPFVPLWYGILALIVTLVVHEGGHGVLARANNMRVKSLGLLFAVVPIGAFVEPDEDELKEAPRHRRLRVFGAGPMVNLVVAALTVGAFAGMVDAVEPVDGTAVLAPEKDLPADRAGIRGGDIIVSADGTPLPDPEAFSAYMDLRSPGEAITFTLASGATHTATLTSRWDTLAEDAKQEVLAYDSEAAKSLCQPYVEGEGSGPACAEALRTEAWLGIRLYDTDYIQGVLSSPWGGGLIRPFIPVPQNSVFFMALPLQEVRGAPVLSLMDDFYEAPGSDTAWFIGANILFWVFWINLMVGLTNILPMLPLDGGHIFRDAAGAVLGRLRPRMDPERREQVVGRTAVTVSFVILTAFLLQIFGPRIAHAFV